MAEQNPLNINVNLTTNAQQAAQQVDQFNLALGRVNQQARRIFASLQELSQRYQQQGFLGMNDQRTLERGIRQWEQHAQRLELQRQGAEGRLALASTQKGEGAALRITQAEGVLRRLTEHQAGLGGLQGTIRNVLSGNVIGETRPWYPGYGLAYGPSGPPRPMGPFTPWYPGYGPMRGPSTPPGWTTPRGPISPWYPGYGPMQGPPAAGATPPTGAFSPWYPGYGLPYGPPGLTPLQAAHGLQFGGMPVTPLQQAHAQLQAQQAAQAQAGLQQAQLVSLMAQMGPQGHSWLYRVGRGAAVGAAGAAVTGGLADIIGGGLGGAIGGAIGGVPGAALGYMAYRGIKGAAATLPARAEREVDILRLGDTLQQQFGDVRETMVAMRREYQILGSEGVRAMQGLASATGHVDRATAMATARVGRYYGMTAGESFDTLTAFRMAGITNPNLATGALLGERVAARYPGAISAQRFLMEAPRIAGAGELAAPPIPEGLAYRFQEYMAGFGGRYATQPAQAFLEQFQGFQQPRGVLGQVLQVQALDQLRRRQRFLEVGGETLDLNDPEDFRVAQEQFGAIPEALGALQTVVGDASGGRSSLGRFLYGAAAGASATRARREFRGMEVYARERGSVARGLREPLNAVEAEAALERRRLAERGQVGLEERRARTLPEEISETTAMRAMLDSQLALTNAMVTATTEINKGMPFLGPLAQAAQDLVNELKNISQAGGITGFLAGLAVQGTGVPEGTAFPGMTMDFARAERQKLLGWLDWFSRPDAMQQQPRK